MLKVNVLIDLFFKELSFAERVGKIKECGYDYIETWQGADAKVLKDIADAGKDCGVELISIVLNGPGNKDISPVDKNTHEKFIEQLDRYSDNALAAGCKRGIVTTGETLTGIPFDEQKDTAIDIIRKAGELLRKKGFAITLEPLNTIVDHQGYFLESREVGIEMVKAISLDNVSLLYDIYHMEIMTGNHTEFILENIGHIGHFHSAGVPGRNEPFNGETNYPHLLQKINDAGYDGYFGLEYIPLLESRESLEKTLKYFKC